MSLSIKQKQEIRNIKFGWFYSINENGAPHRELSAEKAPNYEVGQLRQMVLKSIRDKGYNFYHVKPNSANCIIRVYKEEKVFDGTKYRFLGAHCFTKAQDGKWYAMSKNGEEFGIDFTKHEIRIWFFQDEYWDASVDFFDTFVKLVKE